MKNAAATEKQIARFARKEAKVATKLRAAGLHEAAADHVRRASEAAEAMRQVDQAAV